MPISEAESAVMQVLWERHPLTAEEIAAALGAARQWQEATVKTLLNRLLNKGAIAAVKEGRRYLYSPLLQREAYVHAQSKDLLDRLFDGRLAPLVAHFSARQKLGAADIAELKRLIAELPDDE
ncbi:BlaI/MecI/CopY family transcriptional regulator [Tahibacter harae]|uniref:BlaI/MecI/CopY family transcriptional regulator n=1 Tax=Tahibacter harae TaxID=2963937 RepID=A0ABT1QXE0_9GAMM|nr:BlaI/MecI/CopY family transcriptional regulator [Tahibacter harae]MCQ4166960.1 BlaI/MecI/CopY family transcriptional regulator [Tahibacter harae]